MSDDDILRRDVIYRLMCHGKIDGAAVSRDWNIDFDRYFAPEIESLADDRRDGLLTDDESTIELTPLGYVLMRNVARRFDRYLRQGRRGEGPRFSRTV